MALAIDTESHEELKRQLAQCEFDCAGMADEIAFWAYQAKWYFARANGLGSYDDLSAAQQRAIDVTFEEARRAENRERIGHVEPAHDIGS